MNDGFREHDDLDVGYGADEDAFPMMAEALHAPVPFPALSVTVDFNDLLQSIGETDAFRILGALKDLLA
jgi:hypothetical protein